MHDSILALHAREGRPISGEFPKAISRPSVVSFASDRSRVFCSTCQQIVVTVTVAEAAEAFNTDIQDIGFLLRKDEIHMIGRDPAVIFICRNSVEWCFESRQTRLLDSHFETVVQQSFNDTQRE
jgi:hypothetical protein